MSHLAALAAPDASRPTTAATRTDSLGERFIADLLLVGTLAWATQVVVDVAVCSIITRGWVKCLHARQLEDKLSTNRQRFEAVDDRKEAPKRKGRGEAG